MDEFILEDEWPVVSVGQLLAKFHDEGVYKQSELKPAFKGKKIAIDPQVVVLNPLGWGKSPSLVSDEIYVAIYYHGYFVRIEHGASMFGPHVFKLYYQVRQGLRIWLGTSKGKFLFHSTPQLRDCLKQSLRSRDYYCSPKNALAIVELKPRGPEGEVIHLGA